MTRPLDLYYWPTPNGWKISIALEEMGLPYQLHPVNISRGDQFAPEFLKISPNNRMPAVVDHDGIEGRPISVFESGAILQYLGRKTGQFYSQDPGLQVEIDQWLFWQMAGLGPMAGQSHHFRLYGRAITQDSRHLAYGANRYTNEVRRLWGVLERRLVDRDYVAGAYSIADMAIYPWIVPYKDQGQSFDQFPKLKAWFERVGARPGVQAGLKVGEDLRRPLTAMSSEELKAASKALFGQR